MKKRILLCSSAGNPHIVRLLKVICEQQTGVQVDYMSLSFVKDKDANEISPYVTNCYIIKSDGKSHSSIIKIFHQIKSIIQLKKQISSNYDCIVICAITIKYILLFNKLRKIARTLVLYPWGSEVIKADKKSLIILQWFYSMADKVITIRNSRFEQILFDKLGLSKSKMVDIPYGSELIDKHISRLLSRNEAKALYGLQEKYVITCAYNGFKTQNHLSIIDELVLSKSVLPNNSHLVFPMTYGLESGYREMIEERLINSGFSYTIITDFMPLDRLYGLQCASDVFIHVQKTDASSSSVKEFILAGALVFNGAWLSYPEIEIHGVPYIPVDNINDLSFKIKYCYENHIESVATTEMLDDIKRFSHSNFVTNWQKAVVEWTA